MALANVLGIRGPGPIHRGPKPGKVCSFFNTVRGCSKGNQCDFLHQAVRKQNKPCAFFEKSGSCKKGESCEFMHGPDDAPSSSSSSEKTPEEIPTVTASSSEYTTTSYTTVSQPVVSQPVVSQPVSTSASASTEKRSKCLYFNTPNGCKKGDECDFAHIKGERTNPPPPAPVSQVCSFWNTVNGCRKGASCNFQHPGYVGVQNSRDGKKVCAYFVSPKGCVKGNECDFEHVYPTSVYNASAEATGNLAQQSAYAGYASYPSYPVQASSAFPVAPEVYTAQQQQAFAQQQAMYAQYAADPNSAAAYEAYQSYYDQNGQLTSGNAYASTAYYGQQQ